MVRTIYEFYLHFISVKTEEQWEVIYVSTVD